MDKKKACFIGLVAAVLAFAAGAQALDVGEVKDMLRADVPESAIVNLAESQGGFYLTEAEISDLRTFGASEDLIAALRYIPIPDDDPSASIASPPTVVGSSSTYAGPAVVSEHIESDPPGAAIFPLTVSPPASFSALRDKEGQLVVSNRDYQTYFLQINVKDKRMFLSRFPNGGVAVEPGESVALNVVKEGYKLYGDNGNKLEVKIRENETTTLSFDPFGVVGNSGLNVVAVNRDRVRNETLFDNYAPAPVVVAPAPQIIYQPAPPVIIREPRPGFSFGFHFGGGSRHRRHRRW